MFKRFAAAVAFAVSLMWASVGVTAALGLSAAELLSAWWGFPAYITVVAVGVLGVFAILTMPKRGPRQ